jgi:hypothetical protein
MHKKRDELAQASAALRAELLAKGIPLSLQQQPIENLSDVLADLQGACPGHSSNSYADALRSAFWENR